MIKGKFISVIIPCRNEENYIGKCLDSIIANDYPKDCLEVLVMDGRSEDRTRDIVQQYMLKYNFIKLLDNPKRITPCAINIGIDNAAGEAIILLNAHTCYQNNYISGLVSYLGSTNADVVGGVCLTQPGNDTPLAQAIARGLAHPFGVGNAYFRIGTTTPRWADTVPFGCYRREVFTRIGKFDEELVRNQDDELNLRLLKQGGRLLLVPEIVSYYYARDSLFKLWRMYYQYGYFKPLVAYKVGGILTIRQIVPPAFIAGLLITAFLGFWVTPIMKVFLGLNVIYWSAVIGFSVRAAIKKSTSSMLLLSLVFPVLHFGYGLGFLKGAFDLLFLRRNKKVENIPLSR